MDAAGACSRLQTAGMATHVDAPALPLAPFEVIGGAAPSWPLPCSGWGPARGLPSPTPLTPHSVGEVLQLISGSSRKLRQQRQHGIRAELIRSRHRIGHPVIT